MPQLQQQKQQTSCVVQLVRLPAAHPPQAPRAGQLKRLEQHQLHLRHIRQRQEQERQQRLWLEGERQRQELQKQLERQQALRQWQKQERQRIEWQRQLKRQRQELLQIQLCQEHRQRRQLLQWQLELEQRLKRQQKIQSTKRISPSHGLCTIYEAMEIIEDENVEKNWAPVRKDLGGQKNSTHLPLSLTNRNLSQTQHEPDWNYKMDVVQKLINQALLLEGDNGCPPLLYLPGQGGGTLSPLESSSWPQMLHQLSNASATITSVCSYSPTQGSSPQGDWTIVELETYH
ncbi:trichohyalin-like [Tachysurus ichikawai]